MDALPLFATIIIETILVIYFLILIVQQQKKKENEFKRIAEQNLLRQQAKQNLLRQQAEMEEQQRKRELLIQNRRKIQEAYTEYKKLNESDSYFTIKNYREWETRWNSIKLIVQINIPIEDDFDNKVRSLRNFFSTGEDGVRKRNDIYVSNELLRYRAFFDAFQGRKLSDNQRRAVVVDEHSNIVVAGAGTGKTKTLLAKAAYVSRKGYSNPEKVLIMAFNSKVRKEIISECASLNLPCQIETYHSMGLEIISKARERQPSVTKLTEDKNTFVMHIQRYLNQLIDEVQETTLPEILYGSIKSLDYKWKLLNYFSYYSREYINPFNFETLGDYYRYVKNNGLRTLKNDKVKSYEEFEIANYLHLKGIEYRYEDKYKFETASIEHPQYRPDFYLPAYGIYIEHYAINKNDKTPQFIDEAKYRREMEWKADIHEKNGTILLKTYSYEHEKGNLLQRLEAKLLERGVEFKPINPEEALKTFKESGEVTLFANLVAKFLNLFKASGQSIQEIRQAAEGYSDPMRARAFLDLFEPILHLYQNELKLNGDVDFNDMINEATHYLESGKIEVDYNYILVDEFQDISQSRFKFLKALQESSGAKLFCVGDDWQAIYRFTGGDVSLMTNFQEYFDPYERLNLDKTYRFNSGILDVSSRFVMQNPGQLKKNLLTDDITSIPTVTLKWADKLDEVDECLYLIEEFSDKEKSKVFILGRYRQGSSLDLDTIRKRHPGLVIEYHTVHSSKGLEADYVIIVDVDSGVKGFPCLIEDDPLLSLVLSRAEEFSNAEERRLFYVALTRASRGVYILSDFWNPSDFVEEIVKGRYFVNYDSDFREILSCSVCSTGKMMPINGKNGLYYRCSNHPLCKHKMNPKWSTKMRV